MANIVVPRGANYDETLDGFSLRCSTRSAEAFFLVPFTLVWSGFSLGGIYGSQFSSGKFDPFMSLFGIIFIAGSVLLISYTLMSVCGEVRFDLRNNRLYYFSGISPIGTKKNFDWQSIESAKEEIESWGKGGRPRHAIYLEGSQRYVVGQSLSSSHRYFVVNILNEKLRKKNGA